MLKIDKSKRLTDKDLLVHKKVNDHIRSETLKNAFNETLTYALYVISIFLFILALIYIFHLLKENDWSEIKIILKTSFLSVVSYAGGYLKKSLDLKK